MHPLLRILGIFVVFLVAVTAWLGLAGVTDSRSSGSGASLRDEVGSLWGNQQVQAAPSFTLVWSEEVFTSRDVKDPTGEVVKREVESHFEHRSQVVGPASSALDVNLHLDERRRGLLWFPLYDVAFSGEWTYVHRQDVARDLLLAFTLPDQNAVYDDVHFVVDGNDLARDLQPEQGVTSTTVHVEPGQIVRFAVSYRSRGADSWTYQPTVGVGQLEAFALTMHTDFADVDFPVPGLSPTAKEQDGAGWTLHWDFARVVTGFGIGMIMPTHIQPGELATSLSLSAPLSLGLFFLWIYVLGVLRDRQVHPINYLFIGAAFFAFNLLFAYTADRLPVEWAFALSALVSLGLVVSYLRLVVGARFAVMEAGIAQVLYQIGFAAAHFFDGFTGLTITVLGILTLFALMQLTGRIDWNAALTRRTGNKEPAQPPSPAAAG